MKMTAGCTESQDNWSQANWQHVVSLYFFSKVEISK